MGLIGGKLPDAMQFGREVAQIRFAMAQAFSQACDLTILEYVQGSHRFQSWCNCQDRYPSPGRSDPPRIGPASLGGWQKSAICVPLTEFFLALLCKSTEPAPNINKHKGSNPCVNSHSCSRHSQSPAYQHVSTLILNVALQVQRQARWLLTQLAAMSLLARPSVVRSAQPATIWALQPVNNLNRSTGRLNTLNRRWGLITPAAVLHSKDQF